MTPFQILLIDLIIVFFAGIFSYSTRITNPKASNAFGVISGLAFLATPIFAAWCVLHYIHM